MWQKEAMTAACVLVHPGPKPPSICHAFFKLLADKKVLSMIAT